MKTRIRIASAILCFLAASNSFGGPVKSQSQLVGTWYHVGKMQQFFGSDILGLEFLKGGKLLLSGGEEGAITWDYAFQDDGKISVTIQGGLSDIWNCSIDGTTLTVQPESDPEQKYQYRRLSGQSIIEAHKAEKKDANVPEPPKSEEPKAPMGGPVAVGDMVETSINGQNVIGEVIVSRGNTADLDLGQNNISTYLTVEYMRVLQHSGSGTSTFGVGDVVQVPYMQGLAGTVLLQGKILKVNGGYCKIDSSGSGFTGWTKAAELRLVQKGPPQAVLSVVTTFSAQPPVDNPLIGHGVALLRASFETVLAEAGIRPSAGASAIEVWATACKNQTPDCQRGLIALGPYAVGNVKIDPKGNATFPSVPPGTYYVFGTTRYGNGHLLWNQKADLKPGANSVTLDERNATPINY